MTEKICTAQRENTEQINKSTELMRENHRLQEEMKVKQESWEAYEKKIEEQLEALYEEKEKNRNQINCLERIRIENSENLMELKDRVTDLMPTFKPLQPRKREKVQIIQIKKHHGEL